MQITKQLYHFMWVPFQHGIIHPQAADGGDSLRMLQICSFSSF